MLGAAGRIGRAAIDHLADSTVAIVPVTSSVPPADVVAPGDVVLNLATSAPEVVHPWALAGSRAAGYLDVAPTPATHDAVAELDLGPAPVAPGVGFASAVGDALAVVAAGRLTDPVRVDVTTWVPTRRSLLSGATPRERADLLRAVREPMTVLEDGRPRRERIAEARRLAWFPRPVGPHHAAGVPGSHERTLPRVLPTVRTVRTGLALRSSSAEVVQGLGNLSRWEAGRRLVDRLAARPGPDRGTEGERWALVVEVAAEDGTLVRAWAYGHDRHDLTARLAARLGTSLATADAARPGHAVGAVELQDPEVLLDGLAAATDLRWSVSEPAATG